MGKGWKKTIVLLLALCLTVMVAACGNGNSNGGASSGGDGAPQQEEVNLRFMWWGGEARNAATFAAIEAYMEKNPHVKIEGQFEAWGTYFEKLLTQLVGNNAPDIVQIDYQFVPDLINQGKPFVNMLELSDQIDMSGFDLDFAKSFGGGDDYLIGLPTGINGISNIYNVDLAKELGIDMTDSATWDWEDLIEVGQEVNKQDPDKYFIYFKKEMQLAVVKTMLKQMNGNNLIKDDYTLGFTSEEMTEIFSYIRRLVDTKTIPPFEIGTVYETQNADNPDWLKSRYVMASTYAAIIPDFIDASPFDIESSRFFVMDNPVDKGVPATPTNMLGIYNKSKHVDEAAKFLDWFYNDEEAIRILGDVRGVPAVQKARDLLVSENTMMPQIVSGVNYALDWTGIPDNAPSLLAEVTNRVMDFIHEVGFGRTSPEDAADALSKELELMLAPLKK